MKTNLRPLVILLSALSLCCLNHLSAQVPRIISFQGQAVGANGNPLNGSFNLTFRIYNAATGSVPLWTETHTNVEISRGIFAVQLGTITPLTPPFDQPYWLSIQVGTNPELAPRERLTSAPYALRAAEADALNSNAVAVIKSNILASVPSSGSLPSGVVLMWYGSINNIPTGWALCNGQNGTPDLRDRFIVGASVNDQGLAKTTIEGSPTQTGGSSTHLHTGTTTDAVRLIYPRNTAPGSNVDLDDNSGGTDWEVLDPHSHTFIASTEKHLPPYFALAFIIKL